MKIEASPPQLPKPMSRSFFHASTMLEEPIDLERFPTVAMNAAQCLLGVGSCSYAEVDTGAMRASAVFDSSLAHSGSLVDAWSSYMLEEPILSHWKWPESGFVILTSDYVSPTQLHRMEIYESCLHPLGIEHFLFAQFLRTSNRILSIGCGREHDFSKEERYALMLLSPHLSMCRRHCEVHSIARAHQPIVHTDLAVTQVQLVVVGRDGRVRSMTSRAAEMIRRHVGEFPRCSPRLPVRLQPHVSSTVHGVARPRSSQHFGDLEVFTMNDCDGVSLYLCQRQQLSIETLARAIGTSPRRAEVGRYLCRGAPKEEIAEKLDISPGTVRRHVEDLYTTLGVSRQLEAVDELRRRVADYLRRYGYGSPV